MSTAYVIGDIHGQYEKLVALLRGADLVTDELSWGGNDATLCFVGDFVDRGPDGIGCIELVMRLQREAADAGGQVIALLGNHEPLLLAAHRFGMHSETNWGDLFMANWIRNGGNQHDMDRLTDEHIEWIMALPAMAHIGDRLIIHADSLMYSRHGETVDEVNAAISKLLESDIVMVWDALLYEFAERNLFYGDSVEGIVRAQEVLDRFGGTQLIHGHTPISYITRRAPSSITEPMVYADNLCVNVDGGLYLGGAGFVHQLPHLSPEVDT